MAQSETTTPNHTAGPAQDDLWFVTILRDGNHFLDLSPVGDEQAAREQAQSEIVGRANDAYYPGGHEWSAEIGIIGLPPTDTLVPCAKGENAVVGMDDMCSLHGSEAWYFESRDDNDDDW